MFRALLAVVLLFAGNCLAAPAKGAGKLSYNRDIRPLLSDNCFYCHGPDQNKRKAKLRLDVRDAALAKEAFVPGNPQKSELIRRINADGTDDLMPPAESHKTLTAAQKDLLRRWIAEGAVYEKHWAYVLPVKPTAPAGAKAIDFLVQQRLREIGLKPSPAADRRILARRLSFDLIGLPPSPEEVAAFEKDKSPAAYANFVEKLLSSPHYGERMAIGWLDVVRYADTVGYHSDVPRNVWPYRDYVIRSFNQNKHFDQFTREQLAGDLLPGSGIEQKVGSAYNRLLLTTEEGGAQPKDYEARMFTDRVRDLSAVWLGQTIGCAQCHDHKFDPITSRDFYSLAAIFADVREASIGHREEGMPVPDAKQASELAALDSKIAQCQRGYETRRNDLAGEWEAQARTTLDTETNWIALEPEKMVSEAGVKLSADDIGVISSDKDPKDGKDTYRISFKTSLKDMAGFRLEALYNEKLPGQGPGRGVNGAFILTELSVEGEHSKPIALTQVSATFEAPGNPASAIVDGNLDPTNGWSIRGVTGGNQSIYFAINSGNGVTELSEGLVTFIIRQSAGGNNVLGRFRLSATSNLEAVHAVKVALPPADIVKIIQTPSNKRNQPEQQTLADYVGRSTPGLREARQALAQAKKARADFEAALPHCLVSGMADQPRVVRILPRGDFMNESGDIVTPALPGYLTVSTPRVEGRRLNRLDLANWLVSRDNPLVARVFVNRLWKQFFGIGLSKVLDDFGMQGEPPVHPELLDWLASEFMESGWDIKHMVRLMVASQTYQQVSTASSKLQERDPYNRYLARQSRWRIDAELVRDNALKISGLLVNKIGGPSVKPYQPDGYWENLNFPPRNYEADKGQDQYRRGLYTWWQRTFLHPSLLAFDAPSREECAAERNRSNIPQQALALLNDPTYVEAARAFAARILKSGGDTTVARLEWAWHQALARSPRKDEFETASQLLDHHLTEYRRDPQAAAALLKVGLSSAPTDLDVPGLAAWTSVARVILNLHETITRN